MGRGAKKIDSDALIGETALVRAQQWQNGGKKIAAVITEATTDAEILPEKAIAVVSLTAFPPSAPVQYLREVPLYLGESDMLPAAWLK